MLPWSMNLAKSLLSEHCSTARNTIRLVVQWFSFAISANVIVGGWFIARLFDKQMDDNLTIILTVAFVIVFVFANMLGVWAAWPVGKAIREHYEAVDKIIRTDGIVKTIKNPIPLKLFIKVTNYFAFALLATSVVWVIGLISIWQIRWL